MYLYDLEPLIEQSMQPEDWEGRRHFSKERFAELIVQECIKIAHQYATELIDNDMVDESAVASIVADRITQHFGVE